MSVPLRSVVFCWFVAVCGLAAAAAPWHHPLYLAGHGWWTVRVPVTITNPGTNAPVGWPVAVPATALAGQNIASLRVCNSNGLELLFDVLDQAGAPKHAGHFEPADRIMVPSEALPGRTTTVFLYAGNEAALAVPDYLALKSGAGATVQQVSVRAVEKLSLGGSPVLPPRFSADWPVVAVIRVINVQSGALENILVTADLRATLGRWLKIQPDAAVRVVDAASGHAVPGSIRLHNNLLFAANVPARSRRDFYAYIAPRPQDSKATLGGYGRLLDAAVNRISNPSFEKDERGWTFGDAAARRRFTATVASNGLFGSRSLIFTVPADAPASWVGWHSEEIPVRSGATYFFSGFLQGSALDGAAMLHAHWHDRAGRMTANGAYAGTGPSIIGAAAWTQTSGIIQAPADAATIQLHLTMNAHGTLQHDGLLFCEVLPGEVLRIATEESFASASAKLRVAAVNPLIKVLADDPPAPVCRKVDVECAQNEFEPVQLVVTAGRAAKNLRVTISPLRGPGGATLPAPEIDRVAWVPVDYPSAYFSSKAEAWQRKVPHGTGSTDGWAGNWPDPLVPLEARPCDLPAQHNQPVWLTIRTLVDTPPGRYHGEIKVQAEGADTVVLPMDVTVHPFALPDRTQLRAIFDLRYGPGGGFGTGKSGEPRKEWLRFLAQHRIGIDAIEPAPVFTYTNGRVTMDATSFDEAARFCFDELGMNVAYTPHVFYMFGWAYPPRKWFGLEPFTAEWSSAFRQAYGLFARHLREKGWHDKFVYYISDEPHFNHEFVVDQMKRLCALIHEVDATIPIYSSTWRHCSAWDGALDLWGVGQYGCFPVPELEQLRRAGKSFWFTCDGQMATDTPYLATERMLPYYCFKYGAGGFEFWGVSWWTYDPWQTGWHSFIRQSDDGRQFYWTRYPNGDGFLVYPGPPAGVSGLVSTIRLEQVREGLEDFEALSILSGLVKSVKKSGRDAAAGERALDMARDLVTIPNAGGLRSTEILADPDRIPAIRKNVNAAIVQLMKNRSSK